MRTSRWRNKNNGTNRLIIGRESALLSFQVQLARLRPCRNRSQSLLLKWDVMVREDMSVRKVGGRGLIRAKSFFFFSFPSVARKLSANQNPKLLSVDPPPSVPSSVPEESLTRNSVYGNEYIPAHRSRPVIEGLFAYQSNDDPRYQGSILESVQTSS
jgi:hypothetical protein